MLASMEEPWAINQGDDTRPVLITGANGFVGSCVVRLLRSRGLAVRCWIRKGSSGERLRGWGAEVVASESVFDAEHLDQALRGCSGVIHLASPSRWSEIGRPAVRRPVVEGTRAVLAAARTVGLPVTYVSSAAAGGGTVHPTVRSEEQRGELDPVRFPYAAAKAEAEALCREAAAGGMRAVIVRPAEVYGPGDSDWITAGALHTWIYRSPVLTTAGGAGILHLEEAAEGIVTTHFCGQSGSTYYLGGENLSFRQLAELTLRAAGKRAPVRTVPPWLVRCGLLFGDGGIRRLGWSRAAVEYGCRFWFFDNGRARRELGLRFRSAEETIAETVSWLQETQIKPGTGLAGPPESLQPGRRC